MSKLEIENSKPVNNTLTYIITFYEDENIKNNTWGSNNISCEIYWNSQNGIMEVDEIEAFGDRTLITSYHDRRGRGITLDEMLENIKQMSEMTYKEFKERILKND